MDVTNDLLMGSVNTLIALVLMSTVTVLLAVLDIARMYVRIAEAGPQAQKVIKIAKDTRFRILNGIFVYIILVGVVMWKGGYPLW